MRNKHNIVPTKQIKKVVRMNNNDYIVKSVFDGGEDVDTDERYEEEMYKYIKTHTVFDEVPWYRMVHRRPRRIMEDFFDDLDDISQEIVNQEEDILDDPSNNSYIMTLADGSTKEIQFSEDSIKNAIFYLLLNFMIITGDSEYSSVNDLIYNSGKMNNMMSYKIDICGIDYKDGAYKLIIGGRKNGFLQVYFVDSQNANFKIVFDKINIRRPGDMAVFTYKQFCNFLKCDRITLRQKSASEYYKPIIADLMTQYQKAGINVTICKTKTPVEERFMGHTVADKFIPTFFTPVAKYGKNKAEYSTIINLIDTDIDKIDGFYSEGSSSLVADDEYYVLVGGNESYVRNIQNSAWASMNDSIDRSNYIRISFSTPDPELRTNKIQHNMLLIPFSRFVASSPGLLTHMF